MRIKPYGTLVLVEKLNEDTKATSSGLFLSESHGDIFINMKVLAVGDDVKKIKPGIIVIGHDIVETINSTSKTGFISESHIFGEVEEV